MVETIKIPDGRLAEITVAGQIAEGDLLWFREPAPFGAVVEILTRRCVGENDFGEQLIECRYLEGDHSYLVMGDEYQTVYRVLQSACASTTTYQSAAALHSGQTKELYV